MQSSALINLVLGLCAVAYSFVPPERIRQYRRPVALLMRYTGFVLITLSLTSLWLHTSPR